METFSQQVKDELCHTQLSKCPYCIKAELAAMIHMAGSIHLSGNHQISLTVNTQLAVIARRLIKLVKNTYKFDCETRVEQLEKLNKQHRYCLVLPSQPNLIEALYDLGVMTREHTLESEINSNLVKKNCCRAAFLRGAFLASGSLTNPQKKTYHLELITYNEEFANGMVYLMNLLNLKAKISTRKGYYLIYLKESEAITHFLSLINASAAVLKLEEVKVIKGLRGEVNRIVNCETANLEKTLFASWEQLELINYLVNTTGLSSLPPKLRETAELRLEYPDVTLRELGEYHLPPITKSTVNHRLKLISFHVKKLRDQAGK